MSRFIKKVFPLGLMLLMMLTFLGTSVPTHAAINGYTKYVTKFYYPWNNVNIPTVFTYREYNTSLKGYFKGTVRLRYKSQIGITTKVIYLGYLRREM